MNNRNLSNKVRVIHRYLGFFLAGIMFVYALSGITLTFRDKDYFKKPIVVEKTIEKLTERNMLGRLAKSLKLNETGKQKMFDYFEQGEL